MNQLPNFHATLHGVRPESPVTAKMFETHGEHCACLTITAEGCDLKLFTVGKTTSSHARLALVDFLNACLNAAMAAPEVRS